MRRGFTLVEVIIALTILLVVVLSMATTTGQYVRLTAQSETRAVASQLAQEQLQRVQMDPNYAGLESTYAGTESALPNMPGFTRETTVARVGGQGQATDYKLITVIVIGPGLPDPIVRTTSVAAP